MKRRTLVVLAFVAALCMAGCARRNERRYEIMPAEGMSHGAALDDVRDAATLWQATNLWPSASQMDFLRETFKGYAPLLKRGSPAARDELERWYLNVLDLPRRPDGCDERLERTLHERQIDLLASFARYYVDFRHSNCWIYAACELGRIRGARDPAFADRRAWNEAWGRRMLNAGAVGIGEARKMRLREWNRQVSLEKMDCQLTEAVISEFCLKGLAKAPSEFQEPLYTDIVSSARLTPNECAKIREAMRIGESSSTADVPGRR